MAMIKKDQMITALEIVGLGQNYFIHWQVGICFFFEVLIPLFNYLRQNRTYNEVADELDNYVDAMATGLG